MDISKVAVAIGTILIEIMDIAKKNGVYKGRKPNPLPDDFETVVSKWQAGNITATEAMRRLNMKPNTFYRRVNRHRAT